jgi:hypothetical protein
MENKENVNLDENKNILSGKKDNIDSVSVSQSQTNGQTKKNIEWTPENEMIMVEWCDVAQCYKWLNSQAHKNYSYMHAWFTIPAITLSTISGTASFAQASLPVNYQTFAPMVIGALNIFIGILTTIQQYLKISELNEAHRVSSISWDKFARNIRIELAKAPDERTEAKQFIKICRQEFDRLMETSPTIHQKIIDQFNRSFRGKENSVERKRFEQLKKPDICNIIISANEYRHPWYLEQPSLHSETRDEGDMFEQENLAIKIKEEEINEKERILREKEEAENEKKAKREKAHNMFKKGFLELTNKLKQQSKKLEDYIITFNGMYGRKPIVEEIKMYAEPLIESGEIEREALNKFLEKYNPDGVMDTV